MIIGRAEFFAQFGDPGPQPGGCYLTDVERRVLVALARHVAAHLVIEFGVQDGQTARCLWDGCPLIAHYIGIDLPQGATPALASQAPEIPRVPGEAVADRFGFELILRNSRELTAEDLPPADLIFIDGGHDEATVQHDTDLAFTRINPGGCILWHDYNAIPEIGVHHVIDRLNQTTGDNIILVRGTWLCYSFAPGASSASGGRGSSLPRTPTGMGATAGAGEYSSDAVAPVAGAAQQEASNPATAAAAVAGALQAQPASSPVSGGSRRDGESEGARPLGPPAGIPSPSEVLP